MSVTKQIQVEYDKAHQIGYDEITRLAIVVIKRYKIPVEFYMAMGTYFFQDKDGKVLGSHGDTSSYCSNIDKLMGEWDDRFSFTGHPLHITVNGVDVNY